MSSRGNRKYRTLNAPPEGEAWFWLTAELINSVAWRCQSPRCRRFVEFLIAEHCRHAGTENGNLVAPYDQLEAWGIRRRTIRSAIDEAVFVGLVKVTIKGRGPRAPGGRKPARYALTFWRTREFAPASGGWKRHDPREPTLSTSGRMTGGRKSGADKIRAWQKARAAERGENHWKQPEEPEE